VPNLEIVPSHILLSGTDVELTTAIDHREARLKRELDKLQAGYDFVFIDCPPALSWLTINALTASDRVMVIVSPGYFELDSIIQISKTINEVQEHFNPALALVGFLFTMSDRRDSYSLWSTRRRSILTYGTASRFSEDTGSMANAERRPTHGNGLVSNRRSRGVPASSRPTAHSCTSATRPSQRIGTRCYQPSADPGSDTHKRRCSTKGLFMWQRLSAFSGWWERFLV
jgi:AAA domain